MFKVVTRTTVVPAGQTKEVKCSVRTGPLSTKQEVIFEAEEVLEGPEGLNILEAVIWVIIPVTNESNHAVTDTASAPEQQEESHRPVGT